MRIVWKLEAAHKENLPKENALANGGRASATLSSVELTALCATRPIDGYELLAGV